MIDFSSLVKKSEGPLVALERSENCQNDQKNVLRTLRAKVITDAQIMGGL